MGTPFKCMHSRKIGTGSCLAGCHVEPDDVSMGETLGRVGIPAHRLKEFYLAFQQSISAADGHLSSQSWFGCFMLGCGICTRIMRRFRSMLPV